MDNPNTGGAVAAVTGTGSGTTGVVTATLPSAVGKITFLSGFSVSGAGTGTISPVTVSGIVGGPFIYQGISAGGAPFIHAFSPGVPAASVNTPITITTTADGTATAVNVNCWGYQQ
jgi:hypothetical protein